MRALQVGVGVACVSSALLLAPFLAALCTCTALTVNLTDVNFARHLPRPIGDMAEFEFGSHEPRQLSNFIVVRRRALFTRVFVVVRACGVRVCV